MQLAQALHESQHMLSIGHMSFSLNLKLLKRRYVGDYIGDYSRAHHGDTRSLDYCVSNVCWYEVHVFRIIQG